MHARIAEPMKTQHIASTDTGLSGHHLTVARLGTIGLAILTMAVFLPLLPVYLSYLHTVCVDTACPVGRLTPQTVQVLLAVGLSVNAFVACTLVLTLLSLLMCWSVAAVIVWQKSDDWMALLVAVMLMLMGTSYVTHLVLQQPSPWQVPALFLNVLAFGALFLVFSLFPSGRFVPSWISWLPTGWIAWGLLIFLMHDVPGFYQLYLLGYLCELIAIVGTQWHRYRRVSTGVQRQQTKWVVWGSSVAMMSVVVISLPEAFLPSLVQLSWLYRLLDAPALTLALFLGSLSIGMAILRARLWDIDVLINRTLVYGTVTCLLVLVYFGLVIALQTIFQSFTGKSQLTIVMSTLAIAALFQPLRGSVQQAINRRFYRSRYDAVRILASFGVVIRREIDLTLLRERLIAVVEQTLQPTYITLHYVADYTKNPCGSDDPLIDYFSHNPDAVELDQLPTASPSVQALRTDHAALVVPLTSQSDLVGWLGLGPRRGRQGYSQDDRRLLNTLAAQIAPAIQVAQLVQERQAEALERERAEQELRDAQHIQQSLLPKEMPTLPGWQIATYYQPARAVGGDFYDFFPFADGRLGLVIGDVTGDGIPAALVMATTRSILHAVVKADVSPGAVLAQTNTILHPDVPPGMFVTCFYTIIDPRTGVLRYANAGQDLPYLYGRGSADELQARGMPLGLMPEMKYEEQEALLRPGEGVVFYSDGLVEAHNASHEMFGFPRLMQLLIEQRAGAGLIQFLLEQLRTFTGPAWMQEDDITLVTLQRAEEARGVSTSHR